jgi:hypothetical protein
VTGENLMRQWMNNCVLVLQGNQGISEPVTWTRTKYERRRGLLAWCEDSENFKGHLSPQNQVHTQVHCESKIIILFILVIILFAYWMF